MLDNSEEKKINLVPISDCSCQPSILIVDDNIFNMMPLKALMEEQFNLIPDTAENG